MVRSWKAPSHGLLLAMSALLATCCAACAATAVAPVPAVSTPVPATLFPSGSPAPTPPAVDPCALVSADQVHAALGGQAGTAQLDLSNPAVPTCTWVVTGSTIGTGTLRLAVTGTNGTAATFGSLQKAFHGATPVSGVGQQAFAVDPIGQVILFAKGTTLTVAASGFVLDGADPPRPATRSALSAIGKDAATGL
jgi:hypothetical protein